MSSIIIVTGRVTADPVMQQAKNSGTEFSSERFLSEMLPLYEITFCNPNFILPF